MLFGPYKILKNVNCKKYFKLFLEYLLGSSKSDPVSHYTQIQSHSQSTIQTPIEMIGVERSSTKLKTHPCIYCMEKYPRPFKIRHTKLKRHLKDKHRNCEEVSAFQNAMSEEAQFTRNKNRGAHKWNMEVLEKGEGEIIVLRAPSDEENVTHGSYIPCEACLGWVSKTELKRHSFNCKIPTVKPTRKGSFNLINHHMSKECQEVLLNVRKDTIGKDTFSLYPFYYFFKNIFFRPYL